ncbi:hypothetical protein [Ponticaulis sp.]|uniref:hypothetical protein n=1 Tax=Ponticaulis sp. TaxID=2020902 RepID=UPI000C552497|nr:hypothetical protein [Ponticaulis sp.]MAJ10325.1 hypothetical protein [Ponticaulis sp.]HBH91466.1 hypothetical protein [Hyphomonadaceae bacterium]HBJ94301.1 hypothetical protein [Hyphomonadaceae bacterium]
MSDAISSDLSWSNLKASFEAVDPEFYKSVQNPAETFQSIRKIDEWAKKERAQFSDNTKANKSEWVAREVDKIWLERENMAPELKPPIPDKSLSQEARERVDQRIEGVYFQIEQHRKAERQRVLNDPERSIAEKKAPTQAHPLSKATHAEIDNSRNALLKEAETIFGAGQKLDQFRAREAELRTKHHKDIGRAFNEHGINRQPATDQTRSGPSGL